MSDESAERYVLDAEANGIVVLTDTTAGTREGFTGPDRLLKATARKSEHEARDALLAEEAFGGETTQADVDATEREAIEDAAEFQQSPAGFLEDLTGFARRQRLEAMIEELRTIEGSVMALLADDARNLARATDLRHGLEKALKGTAGPSGSPLSDQKPSPVGTDASGPLSDAELDAWREQLVKAGMDALGKPGCFRNERWTS